MTSDLPLASHCDVNGLHLYETPLDDYVGGVHREGEHVAAESYARALFSQQWPMHIVMGKDLDPTMGGEGGD